MTRGSFTCPPLVKTQLRGVSNYLVEGYAREVEKTLSRQQV
jgi:hypothetical protein